MRRLFFLGITLLVALLAQAQIRGNNIVVTVTPNHQDWNYRVGEKAQFGRCTVRVKKAESPGVLFSALGAAPSKKDLALEISARDGDDGVVALEADGKEILRSEPELSDLAVDLASRIEAAADSSPPTSFSAAAPSATSSPTWSAPNARVARNRRRMTFVATTGRPATELA